MIEFGTMTAKMTGLESKGAENFARTLFRIRTRPYHDQSIESLLTVQVGTLISLFLIT
jgi:hypothetical protein